MHIEIVELPELKLMGLYIITDRAGAGTVDMWKEFKGLVVTLSAKEEGVFYSVQLYDHSLGMDKFAPEAKFEKWAALEIGEGQSIADRLHPLSIEAGLYARFIHKGPVTTFPQTLGYFYSSWLPQSDYELDNRPHFERLDHRYLGMNHPDSEEEVWIPVKKKHP